MKLTFRTLLWIETIICLMLSILFLGTSITGNVIGEGIDKINMASLAFLFLGLLGVGGLSYSRHKKKK